MSSLNMSQAQNQSQSLSPLPLTQSYAGITVRSNSPKRKQAIILDSIEGLTIDDYVDGLEELINVNEIRFLSKIANSRVCVYLTGLSTVENIENKSITVKNHTLIIRPYISRNKRVVISNVSPTIPHEDIIRALNVRGITPVSTMTYIRAGTVKPGRSHIMSFRRQIFIKEEDESLLPGTIQMIDDDIPSWIYLSTDSTNCFLCKQSGHIAKLCPKNPSSNNDTPISQTSGSQPSSQIRLTSPPTQTTPSSTGPTLKRPHPPSTNSEKSESEETHDTDKKLPEETSAEANSTFKKPIKSKKVKKITDSSETEEEDIQQLSQLESALQPAKHVIDDPSNHCALNYESFKKFLDETKGKPNSIEIAKEFTDNIDALINMLNLVYNHIDDKTLKTRITKLKKKLLKIAQSESESN